MDGWRSKKSEVERAWPAYNDAADLVTAPRHLNRGRTAFLGGRAASSIVEPPCSPEPLTASDEREAGGRVDGKGRTLLREYLGTRVQQGPGHRQNHAHQWSKRLRRIMPLARCQKKGDVTQCKSFFPRTSWLIDRAVALRQGILGDRDAPRAGRRNATGCLRGPMNEEKLNGTLPAM